MSHHWVREHNGVKHYQDPTWQWGGITQSLGTYALWPWPYRYDLGSQLQSWHTLGSWTTTVWNIIQIQHDSEELWSGHGFWVYVPSDLGLCDMTLGLSHDTPSGHGQQMCEILSIIIEAMKSYCPENDFGYVYTVTLTLEIWLLVKVITNPWVMDNNPAGKYKLKQRRTSTLERHSVRARAKRFNGTLNIRISSKWLGCSWKWYF